MKYIDAEKLIKFKEALADIIVSSQGICTYKDCKDIAEREASLLISTLQQDQPEVDFEEEWDRFEDWVESYDQSDYPTCYEPKQIARHFYELGLNARKEDENGKLAEVMQLAGFKPPYLDGNQYCTLFGIDLMRSFVGFGNTETESFVEALKDIKNFIEK